MTTPIQIPGQTQIKSQRQYDGYVNTLSLGIRSQTGQTLIGFGGETCSEKMVQAFVQSSTAAIIYRNIFGDGDGDDWKGSIEEPNSETVQKYCKLIAQIGTQIWIESNKLRIQIESESQQQKKGT